MGYREKKGCTVEKTFEEKGNKLCLVEGEIIVDARNHNHGFGGQKKGEIGVAIESWRLIDMGGISFYNKGARREKLKDEVIERANRDVRVRSMSRHWQMSHKGNEREKEREHVVVYTLYITPATTAYRR